MRISLLISGFLVFTSLLSGQTSQNRVAITVQNGVRMINSNGIPDHPPGPFPNRGNPHSIREQDYHFRVPEKPAFAAQTTSTHPHLFGVALNGVPFDATTAEFWNRDPRSGWIYEALYKVGLLGMDQNNAHVQPTGAYHYHGIALDFLKQKKGWGTEMTLIGYAADGFPIYGPFCPKDPKNLQSPLVAMKSSFRVKNGHRSSGPGGAHTGEFTQDFEYITSLGDLDECNGREGVTPEYPNGTYYYVLTDEFPHVPRAWKGTPDSSFLKKTRPPGGPGGHPPHPHPHPFE